MPGLCRWWWVITISAQVPRSTCYEVPANYHLTDPTAAHDEIARELAEANRLPEAIASFRAACQFKGDAHSFANLGVALMRNLEFGGAWKALKEALRLSPTSTHAADNLKVLYEFAKTKGVDKHKLESQGQNADLGITPEAGEAAAGRTAVDAPSLENRAGGLPTAANIAERGRAWIQRGEKRLGRGFLMLAMHINPFVGDELGWVANILKDEARSYWAGNLFVGHDKTYLEHLASVDFAESPEPQVYELAIYSWRNLELTGLSCCGIDNMAVFFSRAKAFGHGYVVPFLHLAPNYIPRLKPENQAMYQSFKQWWDSSAPRSMPEPQISYAGPSSWEWDTMKVVLSPSRVPGGWNDFVQAALLYRLGNFEGARHALRSALRVNGELTAVVDELLPGFVDISPRQLGGVHPGAERKYLVLYNPFVGLGNVAVVMVSAHALAKATGRTLVVHWNVNSVTRHAFQLVDQPGVELISDAADAVTVSPSRSEVYHLYLFHMMASDSLGEMLELLGCADPLKALESHRIVTVTSNLYFSPLLRTNPLLLDRGAAPPELPEALKELLEPSPKAQKRALSYATRNDWGRAVPVVALHIRAREEGEDNDDWPTASSPDTTSLQDLVKCAEKAISHELGQSAEWDIFIAATTEKARDAAAQVLSQARGARRVLMLPKLARNRRSAAGAIDAMAEALLISRADVFLRMVIGTQGFSTFAFLSNAMRAQTQWAGILPPLKTGRYAPNYVITNNCGAHRCFRAPPEVRMADVSWHGKAATRRSCGDVIERIDTSTGDKCSLLTPVETTEEL